MALNPVQVSKAVTITWDGVSQRIAAGTVLDSPAASGSNLLQTIGAGNLAALTAQQTGGSPGTDDGVRNSNLRQVLYNSGQN